MRSVQWCKALPVSLFDLLYELVSGEWTTYREYKVLDDVISAVHVKEATNDGRKTRWVDLLYVDLDVLLQVVAIEIQHQVVDKVEPIADDDQWQLVSQLGFLSCMRDMCIWSNQFNLYKGTLIFSAQNVHLTIRQLSATNQKALLYCIIHSKQTHVHAYIHLCKTVPWESSWLSLHRSMSSPGRSSQPPSSDQSCKQPTKHTHLLIIPCTYMYI